MRKLASILLLASVLLVPASLAAQESEGPPAQPQQETEQEQEQDQPETEDTEWTLLSAFDYAANRLNSVVAIVETRFDRPRVDRKYDEWLVFADNPRPLHGLKGSGFLYKKIDGSYYFITTSQLMDNLSQEMEYPIKVEMGDGSTYPAKLVGQDSTFKIAVIEVMLPDSYSVPEGIIGDSEELNVGQPVAMMGTDIEGNNIFVSGGIISSMRKRYPLAEERVDPYIQFDAPFDYGRIGGPMITTQGRIVGLVRKPVAIHAQQTGVNVASPINDVTKIADRIIAGEQRNPFFGWDTIQLTPRARNVRNLPENIKGMLVTNVEEGSPAEIAGLQENDVITRLDGEAMVDQYAFDSLTRNMQIGAQLQVTYYRPATGQIQETTLVVVEEPEEDEGEEGTEGEEGNGEIGETEESE